MPPIDYFSLLQLPRHYNLEMTALTAAYHAAQTQVHPDQVATADATRKSRALLDAALINDAYRTLKSPLLRARYLLSLYELDPDAATLEADFLEQQLELRQSAEEALAARNEKAIDCLLRQLQQASKARQQQLIVLFDNNTTPTAADLAEARLIALEIQFLEKFAHDVEERNEYQ